MGMPDCARSGMPSPRSCGSTIDGTNRADAAAAMLLRGCRFIGMFGDSEGEDDILPAKLAGGRVASLSRRKLSLLLRARSVSLSEHHDFEYSLFLSRCVRA